MNQRFAYCFLVSGLWFLLSPVAANELPAALRVVVNSAQDGVIAPDDGLTLREAIALVNGDLAVEQLSEAEQAQVTPLEKSTTPTEGRTAGAEIAFDLPADQTVIRLTSLLPALTQPGLVIDGTSQSGYDNSKSAIVEQAMPIPIVEITPAEGVEISRGFTIVANDIRIQGLSLYGFTSRPRSTLLTPPADIFIAHRQPPPDVGKQQPPANFSAFYADDLPPKNVVIERNWLGIRPDQTMPDSTSAFGVSVFNSEGTTIRQNYIAYHDGSAVISSVRAEKLTIEGNVLVSNGLAGMPDAIRLEGMVANSVITANLICGNDGSGIYLFKPEGSLQIRANRIAYNGRRLRRAAVFLMGKGHQVSENQISDQTGPGVVVAAYPRSDRNLILQNQFARLEGLSIDLLTENHADVQDYQRGDGPNPPRNSRNRRLDTGNAAINAPRFASVAFSSLDAEPAPAVSPVQISGIADPGAEIELYRVTENSSANGPLSQPLARVTTDDRGQFNTILENLPPGTWLSAIATQPDYGTSEPARNLQIPLPTGNIEAASVPTPRPELPRCVTPPPQPQPPEVVPPPGEPIRLQVPKNIHFALDRDTISPASAAILDRIAQVLRDHPTILIEIEGHTDPRASDAYNLNLGARRAKAARNYLLRRGIAPERMTIRSLGERQRIAAGSSRLDYARDRRVEFTFKDARNFEVIVQETDLQLEPAGGVR
jgi:outer membrane protein OmpA-like peptidoglycan-associated protein